MRLRLVADDLTGALDSAAQFVGRVGPVAVYWTSPALDGLPPSVAIDSGTREQGSRAAGAVAERLAPLLAPAADTIAFFKVDSLLRGNAGAELAAVLRATGARRCIIAPAFPFQRRAMRGGVQHALFGSDWQQVGEDVRAALEGEGFPVTLARPGEDVPEGVSLWDTESDDDLRRIVDAGVSLGEPVLWCGSAGLAGALAGPLAPASGPLPRPILGLFGTEHPVTLQQLDACGEHLLRLPHGGAESAAILSDRLQAKGAAFVLLDLPAGLPRPEAARRIDEEMNALGSRITTPRSLIVSGGETLRALCVGLGADYLEVTGQVVPGVPRAFLRGGAWDGVELVSKSGAFGAPDLLAQLVAPARAEQGDPG